MIVIKTFENSDKYGKCLICETEYKAGSPITPMPRCLCGNLHFDINADYVRILIHSSFIKHPTGLNWQEDVLGELKIHNFPKCTVEFSDLSKEEKKQFPSFKIAEDFNVFTTK